MKNLKLAVYLVGLAIIPSVLVWLPFLMGWKEVIGIPIPQGGMENVAANYDGPLYIVIAKSFYNLPFIAANYSFPLPLEYYAAHFPLYPAIIKLFSIPVGFPWGMLLATLSGSLLSLYFFFMFIKQHTSYSNALWLTAIFAVFPARWLIVRSVGSPEPLFVGLILASVYFFNKAYSSSHKKYYWFAAVFGGLAQLTKPPGILLFIAFGLALVLPKLKELAGARGFSKWIRRFEYKAYPLFLIPLALVGLFLFYQNRFGNFFAYFNSGDNIHLFFPPFQIFNYSQPWVNTHWLEEIIFIYLIAVLGLLKLVKQKHVVAACFTGIFVASIFFVSHRDLMRYIIPIVPFLFLGFSKQLSSKEFKIIMAILIIPIYLFALTFISNNVMPISNWTPLL